MSWIAETPELQLAAATDLLVLTAPDGFELVVLRAYITNTDVGNLSDQISGVLHRGSAVTAGTTVTPDCLDVPGATVPTGFAAVHSPSAFTSTESAKFRMGEHIQTGYKLVLTPAEKFVINRDTMVRLRLDRMSVAANRQFVAGIVFDFE